MNKKTLLISLAVIFSLFLILGFTAAGLFNSHNHNNNVTVDENGEYCTVNEVSAYIKEYHKLPKNYITKQEANALGWHGGPLKNYAPGKSIGGDVFTNRQHVLPNSPHKYIECDINANGTNRGAERIVYNSGNFKVYYTPDHYETFTEV
ncbi:MAG: ribonuclease [Methanobrevibacter sp.]|nr:ribonuclease [Methanobrevibacter sp.]